MLNQIPIFVRLDFPLLSPSSPFITHHHPSSPPQTTGNPLVSVVKRPCHLKFNPEISVFHFFAPCFKWHMPPHSSFSTKPLKSPKLSAPKPPTGPLLQGRRVHLMASGLRRLNLEAQGLRLAALGSLGSHRRGRGLVERLEIASGSAGRGELLEMAISIRNSMKFSKAGAGQRKLRVEATNWGFHEECVGIFFEKTWFQLSNR